MNRKNVVAGTVIAVALLLPLGRWVIASRQDAADQKASQQLEQQFRSRQTAATGAPQPQAGGGQWGGPGGRGGGRRGGGGGAQWGQRRQKMQEQMIKEVGLNPAQVKQLDAVRQSARPMMGDVWRNQNLSRDQKMAAMQQLQKAQQDAVSKFMTADQVTKYTAFQDKMRKEREARRAASGGGGWGGPGGPGPGGPGGGPGGPGGFGGPGEGGPRGGGD